MNFLQNYQSMFRQTSAKISMLGEYLISNNIQCNIQNNIEILLIDDICLSIIVPFEDLNCFETMLKKNDNCYYNENWNYEDIQRFQTKEEILNEILRLKNLVNDKIKKKMKAVI